MDSAERQIARLSVRAKVEHVPSVTGFVRQLVTGLGMPEADARRLELAVEEACVNVIEHGFDPGEEGSYDVIVTRRPRQVAVAIEDRGLPFDFGKMEAAGKSGLGTILIKAFADEVHFNSLGRRGKQVEIIKNLPLWDTMPENSMPPAVVSPVPSDIPVELRLMRPEEGINLARLVYRCYGYSYVRDSIYSPETVSEYLKSGLVISYVAVTPDGEIVGHVSLTRERPEDRVGDMGQAVVDPRYRGRGLLEQLSLCVVNKAREDGLAGAFAEAVTAHPYSQKSALFLGFHETGVLLGFIPTTMIFRKIQDKEASRRSSIVLLYIIFNERPEASVYPPRHHENIIRRIYQNAGISRRFLSAGSFTGPAQLPPESQINVSIQTAAGHACIRVLEYGADLESAVRTRLRELCNRRIDCIYLDLPLGSPAVQSTCAAMELLGFFFGGIIPETPAGDVIRLQFLNDVEVDPADSQTASEFSRELFDYVMKARQA